MTSSELKIGKWYTIDNYGYADNIRAKCVDIVANIAYMKFYWGGITRSTIGIDIKRIVGQCKKPGLFSN
jgi:hypothetical protein